MGRVRLLAELERVRPDLDDPLEAVVGGRVMVDGVIITNPESRVLTGSSIIVRPEHRLRGSAKLAPALDAFAVSPLGRTCLDVGAAAGGFTDVLLERGARRVYAVDAGHGQLLGRFRQDDRVTNLEATNVGELTTELVPESIDVITVDVSYLSLREAAAQLSGLDLDADCDLVGLVKPMFELRMARAPTDDASLRRAMLTAVEGLESSGWKVLGRMTSLVGGAAGAIEGFLHARPANVPGRST